MLQDPPKSTERPGGCKRARHLCRFRGRRRRKPRPNVGFKTKNSVGAEPLTAARRRPALGGGPKAARLMGRRDLGDHLLDDGLAERVEVLRHHHEGAGPPMTLSR